MHNVIVAFSNMSAAEAVRHILPKSGFRVKNICKTASEVIRAASSLECGLIICGEKFPDMTVNELSEMISPMYKILVLGGSADGYCRDNVFPLPLPVRRDVFENTVRTLLSYAESSMHKAVNHSHESMDVINRAKEKLMKIHIISEPQAHSMLQKMSMNKGVKLQEAAKQILSEI